MPSLHGLGNRPRSYGRSGAGGVRRARRGDGGDRAQRAGVALAGGSARRARGRAGRRALLIAAALRPQGAGGPRRATRRCCRWRRWPGRCAEWAAPRQARRSRPGSLLYAAWPPLLAAAALRGPDERAFSRPAVVRPRVRLHDGHRRAGRGVGRGLRPPAQGCPQCPPQPAAHRRRRRRVARPRPGGARAQRRYGRRRSPRSPSSACGARRPHGAGSPPPCSFPRWPRWRCSGSTHCTAAIAAFSPTTPSTARCGPARSRRWRWWRRGSAWGPVAHPARAVGARPARGRPRRLVRTRWAAGSCSRRRSTTPSLELVHGVDGGWIDADGRAVTLPARGRSRGHADRRRRPRRLGHRASPRPARRPGADRGDRQGGPAGARARAPARDAARPSRRSCASSRARIVATADAERRRLERDLHDGAQQRLVTLAIGVRLARRRHAAGDPALDGELAAAEARAAVRGGGAARARPRALPGGARRGGARRRDRGARRARAAARAGRHARRALRAAVESAAYFLVGEALRLAPPGRSTSTPAATTERLIVELRRGHRRSRRSRSRRGSRRRRRRDVHRRRPPPASGAAVRLVIADDEMLLREGLARLLEDAGFEIAGRCGDADCAAAHGAGAPARRRDRRHPHAAQRPRRRPARRPGDPPPPSRDRRARALPPPRLPLRDAAAARRCPSGPATC